MAIVITEPIAEIASTTNTTSYATGSFTPTANSLLVTFPFAVSSLTLGAMSGGSLTWTPIYRVLNRAGTSALFAYYAQVGASPAAMTAVFDTSDVGAAAGCLMPVFQVTGHNASNPLAQQKTNVPAANTTNPTITLDANMNTLNGYMAAIYSQAGAPTSTPPAGWTETMDVGISTPTIGMSAAFRAGGETGNTVTFTAASQTWALGFVEINEASVGVIIRPKTLTLLGVG